MAVERAYVAEATRHDPARSPLAGGGWRRPTQPPIANSDLPRALAAIGAVASRYLAVGTPRTLGLVIGSPAQLPHAQLSIDAHRTWFAPRELRCATLDGSKVSELGPPATVTEALAADIVCILVPMEIKAAKLRRGTHINALAPCTLDEDLAALAMVVPEVPGLGKLAAGLVDGRQLDEITVFQAGDASTALSVL
jgi:hypothetical protein